MSALGAASPAFASPLVAGAAPVTTPFENKPTGPYTVFASESQPFSTGSYVGVLFSEVLSGDTSNALGGYTFVYQLSNGANSGGVITNLTINGFSNFTTDGSYKSGTGDQAPTKDYRATANVVGFRFDDLGYLQPGATTDYLTVQTNAHSYTNQIANVIAGSTSPVNAFAPSGSVTPEPTTIAAISGAALLFARRRRA